MGTNKIADKDSLIVNCFVEPFEVINRDIEFHFLHRQTAWENVTSDKEDSRGGMLSHAEDNK